MKKIICILLCLCMLVPMMASCGKKEKGKVAKAQPKDSIVTDDVTFPGETFTVLCREDNSFGDYEYEISSDEGSTDVVNQAVYQRNRDICDIYGLNEIKPVTMAGDWANKDNFVNKFRNSIDAGLGEFDLIMGYQAYMAQGELAQYFYDFYQVDYIKDHLNEDFFYQDFINEMTVNGELKHMVGDYSLTYYDHTFVMYFNKQLAQEYALEDLYALVKDGKWTIDKCIEMSRGKWKDNNNNNWSERDDEDSFGYITDIPNTTDAWTAVFDAPPTVREEGKIKMGYDVGKVTSILEKMVDFFATDDVYTYYATDSDTVDSVPLDRIFREGRALFYPATLQKASMFRSMKIDFGFIPCPKWNEAQDKYRTYAQDAYSVATIPADVKNVKKSGAIFASLTQESNRTVVPAYYDQALKYKLTRDDASAEMLDIIREGFTLNFGMFYGQTIRCVNAFRDCMQQENTAFSNYQASNLPGWENNLDELMKYYE